MEHSETTSSDILIEANDSTFNNIAYQYQNMLGFISMNLNLTIKEVLILLGNINNSYKELSGSIYGTGTKMDAIQNDAMFAKGGQIIGSAYKKLKKELKKKTVLDQQLENELGKRKPIALSLASWSEFDDPPKQIPISERPVKISSDIEKMDFESAEILGMMAVLLKHDPYEKYVRTFNSAIENYVELKDAPQKVLAKLHSVSCGIHSRYHAGSIRPDGHWSDAERLSKQCTTIYSDITFPKKEKFSNDVVKLVNELVDAARTNAERTLLENSGWVNGRRNHGKYQVYEGLGFFRDGRNGSPDFILKNKADRVIGVIEIKRCSSKPDKGNHIVYLKQTAHYQQMLNAVEAFLVYIKPTPTGHGDHLVRLPTEITNFVTDSMRTSFQNIRDFNAAVQGSKK